MTVAELVPTTRASLVEEPYRELDGAPGPMIDELLRSDGLLTVDGLTVDELLRLDELLTIHELLRSDELLTIGRTADDRTNC